MSMGIALIVWRHRGGETCRDDEDVLFEMRCRLTANEDGEGFGEERLD
jgi:hypothetical protein